MTMYDSAKWSRLGAIFLSIKYWQQQSVSMKYLQLLKLWLYKTKLIDSTSQMCFCTHHATLATEVLNIQCTCQPSKHFWQSKCTKNCLFAEWFNVDLRRQTIGNLFSTVRCFGRHIRCVKMSCIVSQCDPLDTQKSVKRGDSIMVLGCFRWQVWRGGF